MKRTSMLLALALGTILAPAPGRATGTILVDAGISPTVFAEQTFGLSGAVEDAGGPVTAAWSGPGTCTIAAPTLLQTDASCSEPGLATFRLDVSGPNGSGSDTVTVVVYRIDQITLATMNGSTGVALPDEVLPTSSSGDLDAATVTVPFDVDAAVHDITATLDWTPQVSDFDLRLRFPDGSFVGGSNGRSRTAKPEVVYTDGAEGTWQARVEPVTGSGDWDLTVVGNRWTGWVPTPSAIVPSVKGNPGDVLALSVEIGGGTAPFTARWEFDPASIAFDDGIGTTVQYPYAGGTRQVRVKVTDANGLEVTSDAFIRPRPTLGAPRAFTVVGVVDGSFSPYHRNWYGNWHPWNRDADDTNDFDFSVEPDEYIDGHPGAIPLDVTLNEGSVASLHGGADAATWAKFGVSRVDNPRLFWFPGTKIVGAISFTGNDFYGDNSAHGSRSAASAAGNVHGTCPTCLVVMIQGSSDDGLLWAARQPWIDVVTNSYGAGTTQGATQGTTRDNITFHTPLAEMRAAADAGKTIVFSAGNGFVNAFDVPMFTYWSSEKGPDWVVTVGAVSPGNEQTYTGSGKPVDISSIGSSYPSSGGTTAGGTGTHSGTSNAAPVTAGFFAEVIQRSREMLGDTTGGYAGGVVASGTPVACGSQVAACALGDGVLTRDELYRTVFSSVLPSNTGVDVQTIPTGPGAYYYQGHGALSGRKAGTNDYAAEIGRMMGIAAGTQAPPARPAGETSWFVVDSYCRQKLWGSWSGGFWQGSAPALDPATDPIASAFWTWCGQLPDDATRSLRPN